MGLDSFSVKKIEALGQSISHIQTHKLLLQNQAVENFYKLQETELVKIYDNDSFGNFIPWSYLKKLSAILMRLCDVSLEDWDRSPAHKFMADFKAWQDKLSCYGAVVLNSSLTKILMIQSGMSTSVRNSNTG